jgi:hypothetical protein
MVRLFFLSSPTVETVPMRTFLLAVAMSSPLAALCAETQLPVPSDAKAQYSVLEVGGAWPKRTIVTRRVGPSGTSYSRRAYDCTHHTVKYLGEGDSLAEMARAKPDQEMAPIVPESIADHVGRAACKR